MTRLMQGFPPAPEAQVTLANWRTPPFNQWAFHHVREIVPSADIPHDPGRALEFPSDPVDMSALRIDADSGRHFSFEEFLEETSTDGFVIVNRGRIIFESYANGTTAETPHILMSVSKSLLGLMAGVLSARGDLHPERPVTDVIPEVTGTAYKGATIRHLLDMRVGVAFDEDYAARSGPMIAYRKATNWSLREPGDAPTDLRSFCREMTESEGLHGGRFKYVSPNTDLLGWVIERATGQRYADLMSELIWKPMGAERDAYITVDRLGAPRCAGGVCATVRDLARLGQLMLEDGSRGSTQIVPSDWINDIARNGDPEAWAAGNLVQYLPGLPIRYRSAWYVWKGAAPILFALGVYGQYLFVDRARSIVISKVSSQALPLDAERIALTLRGVAQIADFLAPMPHRPRRERER
jgi:CubicO group peptidase (beta-lactamase class C family)